MVFSGLFGSKKNKPETKDTEPKVFGNGETTTEGFTFLPAMPSHFNQVTSSDGKQPIAEAPSAGTIASTTPIGSDNQLNKNSELEGIPFQLSPQCEVLLKNAKSSTTDSVPFIKKPDLSQFNYDFSKEKAVLRE